jgi:hypothetical protein
MVLDSLILNHNTVRNTVHSIIMLLSYKILDYNRLYYSIVRYAIQHIRLSIIGYMRLYSLILYHHTVCSITIILKKDTLYYIRLYSIIVRYAIQYISV